MELATGIVGTYKYTIIYLKLCKDERYIMHLDFKPYLIGSAGGNFLPSIVAPWVEFEIFNAVREDHIADYTINRPVIANVISIKSFEPQAAKQLIDIVANSYKKTSMVFRWVANAILHARGIREVRPAASYRTPALIALADAIRNHFAIIQTGRVDGGFRSPLRMLVEIAYADTRIASDAELALLLFMLAEAIGVPCKYVIADGQGSDWRAYVECQVNMDNSWMAFDFGSDEWGVEPPGRKHKLTPDAGPPSNNTTKGLNRLFDNRIIGDLVVPQPLIGSKALEYSHYWKEPKIRPYWFNDLDVAIREMRPDMNVPFLVNRYYKTRNVDIAENFGPEVTGAIIAAATDIYKKNFGNLFLAMTRDASAAFGIDLMQLGEDQRAKLVGDLVRGVFPYAEETYGVEEITLPLRMWWFYCFYPGVQKYDCDDLTLCYMTMAESAGIDTKIRLAGDPGKRAKYHVYPVVNLASGHELVMDVSSPTPWGSEMERGSNFNDYRPRDPNTYVPTFERARRQNSSKNAAGYVMRAPVWTNNYNVGKVNNIMKYYRNDC